MLTPLLCRFIEIARSGQSQTQFRRRATGHPDINGTEVAHPRCEARLALTCRIFDGGIKKAEFQENYSARENRNADLPQQAYREVEEAGSASHGIGMHRQVS